MRLICNVVRQNWFPDGCLLWVETLPHPADAAMRQAAAEVSSGAWSEGWRVIDEEREAYVRIAPPVWRKLNAIDQLPPEVR